jgi:hypothetical protein
MPLTRDDLKAHLVHISAHIVELQVMLSRIESHSGIAETMGVATTSEMSFAVDEAVLEIRASSIGDLSAVERAVRARLQAKAFDSRVLLDLIRTALVSKYS